MWLKLHTHTVFSNGLAIQFMPSYWTVFFRKFHSCLHVQRSEHSRLCSHWMRSTANCILNYIHRFSILLLLVNHVSTKWLRAAGFQSSQLHCQPLCYDTIERNLKFSRRKFLKNKYFWFLDPPLVVNLKICQFWSLLVLVELNSYVCFACWLLRCLFCSVYASDAIVDHRIVDPKLR